MKLGFIVLYVDDVMRTQAFYQQALGLTTRLTFPQEGPLEYIELETPGAVLCIASHNMGEANLGIAYRKGSLSEQPFSQELVFVCDSVTKSFDKAVSAGATVIKAPHQKPWGQEVAYIRSIDGTLIEFCSDMAG